MDGSRMMRVAMGGLLTLAVGGLLTGCPGRQTEEQQIEVAQALQGALFGADLNYLLESPDSPVGTVGESLDDTGLPTVPDDLSSGEEPGEDKDFDPAAKQDEICPSLAFEGAISFEDGISGNAKVDLVYDVTCANGAGSLMADSSASVTLNVTMVDWAIVYDGFTTGGLILDGGAALSYTRTGTLLGGTAELMSTFDALIIEDPFLEETVRFDGVMREFGTFNLAQTEFTGGVEFTEFEYFGRTIDGAMAVTARVEEFTGTFTYTATAFSYASADASFTLDGGYTLTATPTELSLQSDLTVGFNDGEDSASVSTDGLVFVVPDQIPSSGTVDITLSDGAAVTATFDTDSPTTGDVAVTIGDQEFLYNLFDDSWTTA